MLTADLITPRLRWTSTTLSIELIDEQDPECHRIAGELIALLQNQVGCSFDPSPAMIRLWPVTMFAIRIW